MGWAWYLSNDMQFFVITPPILWMYHKVSRIVGWLWVAALVIIHVVCTGWVIHHYDINLVVAAPENGDRYF